MTEKRYNPVVEELEERERMRRQSQQQAASRQSPMQTPRDDLARRLLAAQPISVRFEAVRTIAEVVAEWADDWYVRK